jgi:hypothetical protein
VSTIIEVRRHHLVLGIASPGFLLDWELVALLPSFLSVIFACFVRGLPLHLVSVRPCCALFIKWGESLFRDEHAHRLT